MKPGQHRCYAVLLFKVSNSSSKQVSCKIFKGLLLCCAAQHNVAMMIVVAGALLNERGQVLVSQRKATQSFPGTTP